MKATGRLKLVSGVRDLQIIDADEGNCGIVDDIEFEGNAGGPLRVKALLVGPGGYQARLPGWAMALVRLIAGSKTVRVPWEDIDRIDCVVRLHRRAAELGLGRAEQRARKLLPPSF